jgi:hypothetical protein
VKGAAKRTPEQRRETALKAAATRDPEVHRGAVRRAVCGRRGGAGGRDVERVGEEERCPARPTVPQPTAATRQRSLFVGGGASAGGSRVQESVRLAGSDLAD